MNNYSLQDRVIEEAAWKRTFLNILLLICPFTFALDYKSSSGGGTLAQILMALITLFVFVAIFAAGKLRSTRTVALLLMWSIGVILLGFCVSSIYDAPFENAIRVGFPFFLFIAGLWIGSVASNSLRSSEFLFRGMVFAAVGSLCFRYYYSTGVEQIGLDEMRYQVLSPVLCSLIAYVCATLCYSRIMNYGSLIILMAITTIILISLTRAYVITVLFTAIFLPFVLFRLSYRNAAHKVFRRVRKIGSAFMGVAVIAAVILAVWLRPDVLNNWMGRLFLSPTLTRSGEDVNLVTRLAEIEGIWNSVKETPYTLAFGKGFGNSYEWEIGYVGDVESVSREMIYAFWAPTWNSGHSPFNYALFFGGLSALAWQLYVFIRPLREGWKTLNKLRLITNQSLLQIAVFNMLSILLYLSQSLTANPFGERLSALYIGLSTSILLSFPKLLADSRSLRSSDQMAGV